MMKRFVGILICFSLLLSSSAQAPAVISAADIYLRLKKLNVLGSVLYIAAHPDDENTRLLAYFAKERLLRTGYLSLTRGDGGQNLIGDEQGVELGLIRTQELLSARRIDGAEQFFARAFDFGFTKTTAEALKTWDKEKILSDVVWVIRKFQPDVILTRFPEDSRAGHGQHSASAVLAHEAFAAAADPNRFPEQFKYGVKPWQAKRIMWNTFNFGGTNTTSENQLKTDVGVFNAVLGKSYGEIAAESRSQHKSQGFGVPRSRGEAFEFFTPVAGDAPRTDLFDDVPLTWDRVAGSKKISSQVQSVMDGFSLIAPAKSVPALVNLYREISALPEGYWRTQKLSEVQQMIEACSGIWAEATTTNAYAVQGDSLKITINLLSRTDVHAVIKNVHLELLDSSLQVELVPNKNYTFSKTIPVKNSKPVTQPYWLAQEMAPGSFNVINQLEIGDAQGKPAYEIHFLVNFNGVDFSLSRPVQYKYTDPVKGELYQPLVVIPGVTGFAEPEVVLFTDPSEKQIEVHTKSQSKPSAPPLLLIENTKEMKFRTMGNLHNSTFTFSAKPGSLTQQVLTRNVEVQTGTEKRNLQEMRTIAYDHIPRIDYFRDARSKIMVADVQTSGKRIGYIEGAGDKVPAALQQMGYDVVMLKEKDITPSMLKSMDAIIAGVRAYNVHDWLWDKYEILMDYVNDGGNYIVQYNTASFNGPMKGKIGPFPFNISRTRVTDEFAKVNFLQPAHPVLNFPNKITEKDFDGWVQERGIYFADQLDPKYQTIFSMHDEGEQDQAGSLIIADSGKGKFVYTGLVFFRELPAAVPGAYRLLANIIALNRKKAF
jgi:LmbE family N-acetylglucosaminyl deacetylase